MSRPGALVPAPVPLVQQRDEASCVAACLAMVTGRPQDEIEVPDGATAPDAACWLAMQGIWAEARDYPQDGCLHLLDIPSLNHPGMLHNVVLDLRDGHAVLRDPNKDRSEFVIAATYEEVFGEEPWIGWANPMILHDAREHLGLAPDKWL